MLIADAKQHALDAIQALTRRPIGDKQYVLTLTRREWEAVEAFLRAAADLVDANVRALETNHPEKLLTLDAEPLFKYTIYLEPREATVAELITPDGLDTKVLNREVADGMYQLMKYRAEGQKAKFILRTTDEHFHATILRTFKRAANAAGVTLRVVSDESHFSTEQRSAIYINELLASDPMGEPTFTWKVDSMIIK